MLKTGAKTRGKLLPLKGFLVDYNKIERFDPLEAIKLGMSFGVRFKVRTFGNKHPDGSNVRIFSRISIYVCIYLSVYTYINGCLSSVPLKVHS